MASVKLERVAKVFPGGVRAVDAVDLDVAHGEFVVLVGPSGCGKSTTLRMVAGLEEISEGRLSIGDQVVNEVAARDRDIAMVFQSYALYPHLSVRANLAFGLERRRTHGSRLRRLASGGYRARARGEDQDIEARVQRAAATLGIETLLDRKPGELSGGQRQRVAVGRALVREPEVFLFDEPLSNLDAKLRVEMRAELKDLHARTGATMLYVTHDQEEAMTLGDRLVVMEGGIVQQCAPPSEVYGRPANRFVAGFVGTPAMNFVPGAVERVDGGHALRFEDSQLPLPPAAGLDGRVGTEVVLGVRPDRLRLAPPGAGAAATVRLVEDLGDRVDVRLETAGGVRLAARLGSGTRPPGDSVAWSYDVTDAHLFEPGAHGRRIE